MERHPHALYEGEGHWDWTSTAACWRYGPEHGSPTVLEGGRTAEGGHGSPKQHNCLGRMAGSQVAYKCGTQDQHLYGSRACNYLSCTIHALLLTKVEVLVEVELG